MKLPEHPEIIKLLVRPLIAKHPLPWKIDHDWTVEVHDAKGVCFLKFQAEAAAVELIEFATALAVDDERIEEETRNYLRDSGIEL